jgi:DivIVA domain-containing protein
MTDETFRLTPLDIRRYDFGSALRGYDKTRVDQFRDQVAEEVERLVRHAQDLDAKARGFHEQLRAFRERDKALNEALVSAQQLRGEIREQAEREAQLILREARAEAEKLAETIRAEAERTAEALRADVKRLEDEINTLTRARRTYLAQLRTMIERQLTEVQAAESPSGPPPAAARGNDNKQPEHPTPAWLDSLVKE